MRKLILKMSITADGFVAGPNGEIDWIVQTMMRPAPDWIVDTLAQAGVQIMGRKTFESFAAYWPTAEGELAAPMNDVPKIVFSKTGQVKLPDAQRGAPNPALRTWQEAEIATDIFTTIPTLKAQNGGYILVQGGAAFVRDLVAAGLVDEYRLAIHPICIGKGVSIFDGLDGYLKLKLVSSSPFASGTIGNVYVPA